jgi:hypothetical protein
MCIKYNKLGIVTQYWFDCKTDKNKLIRSQNKKWQSSKEKIFYLGYT